MLEAIETSLDHLRAWMPWAMHEPEPAERKRKLVRRFRLKFELGRDLVYSIFDGADDSVVGGCGVHSRVGAGAAEIGYWIHAEKINQGYATEASAALVHVGFERLGLKLIEVHCDTKNHATVAVPRKLGFDELPPIASWVNELGATPRDTLIFRMTAAQYPGSAAAQTPVALSRDGWHG